MEEEEEKVINKIIKCLKNGEKTIKEIANEVEVSRITVTKYLHYLLGKGIVEYREVGKAKLFRLK